MQQLNVSSCQKNVSEISCYVTTTVKCPTYLVTLISVHRIAILLFLLFSDKNIIMLVMQKLKVMLEFNFAVSVNCEHSNLLAKLLMHKCKHAKTFKCSIQRIFQVH